MSGVSPWLVTIIGLCTVFIGLVCLILLTKLMSLLLKKGDNGQTGKSQISDNIEPVTERETTGAALCPIPDRQCFDAVVAAAIATYMGGDVEGLRLRSVKCLHEAELGHDQLVAIIAASVASTMEQDVNGLRIRSIKKI